MTARGFWFMTAASAALFISIALPYQFSITFLSTAALLGMTLSWGIYRLRLDLVAKRLELERTIDGQPAGAKVLWEGRVARVQLTIRNLRTFPLPLLKITDLVPVSTEVRGAWATWGRCDSSRPLVIEYEIRPRVPGSLRFEGARLEIKDALGFFSSVLVLRAPVVVTVWPALIEGGLTHVARKRANRLSGHGVHRYLRPGTGTELLNLRDYVEGDPPKRIAWKISARRGQLTTKELESEVPVRCWILVDHSDSVRLGWPGATALHQSARLAASLTEHLISRRDPVGLWLIDEHGTSCLPPAPGTRQRSRILSELCRVASLAPEPGPCPVPLLLDPVLDTAKRIYPDLLLPKVNPRDWRYEWPWSRILWQGMAVAIVSAGMLALVGLALWRRELPLWLRGAIVGVGGLVSIVIGVLTLRGRSAKRGAARRQRRQVAALVAAVGDLGPAGLALCLHDDEYFSRRLQEFLIVHGVSYPRPLYDAAGRYLFQNAHKLNQAAKAILRTISHGRDDEVFILLIDLLEHQAAWGELINAIRVARARHHHVVVVCPWPEDVSLPDAARDVVRDEERLDAGRPAAIVGQALAQRYQRAFRNASVQLRRMGVPLIAASSASSTAEVLRRVEMVRAARIPAHH